ncbi:integral membrane protein [Byssothecium circinans]|uniref:Integral membrane protein n=1 Tax=Byssothecium circinans TaxID=147558 RepID=A0A6A5U772_9PLEO|nr:integral membrane protein [Byssothecium circinans]
MYLTRITIFASAFLLLWMTYRIHDISSRDPTSVFFNPRHGYTPRYSTIRKQQASDFIASANVSSYTTPNVPDDAPTKKKLCVGIPSMASRGPEYLRDTVRSLLAGLTPIERAAIHFTVFIPHTDPSAHPAFTESWLAALVDTILTYDVPAAEFAHIQALEAEGGEYKEKGLYDYRYLLKYCAKQNTPYIAIFEDDIVAMDGWYHRAMAAVKQVEKRSAEEFASTEFLYLRLFHTEEFLGWNSEDWRMYLFRSICAFAAPMSVVYLLKTRNATASRLVTTRVLVALSICIPLLIGLFFALGCITVAPLPTGVSLMPKYGCCSQAFIFPRSRALMLVNYFAERKAGPVDALIEDFANERNELRWAVSPCLVQHVGRKSSKVDDFGSMSKYGMSVAEKIWCFGFEDHDVGELEREHGWAEETKRKEQESLRVD